MEKLTVFVVEDEAPARERLLAFIDAHPALKLVGWCDSGEQALAQIPATRPDLIFLDIHLGDISGLDVLKMLNEKPQVIFSTAYDRYAIQAFELSAVDYLLKPYTFDRFQQAVAKAIQYRRPATRRKHPLSATESVRMHQPLRRIPARVGERIYLLPVESIVYFSSEDKVVFAHLTDKSYIVNYTLEELEHRLDGEQFFRIHRSTIVNLNFVQSIEPYLGGSYIMEVKDRKRSQLHISRNAARRLREKLGW